jgi:hypothetical protein
MTDEQPSNSTPERPDEGAHENDEPTSSDVAEGTSPTDIDAFRVVRKLVSDQSEQATRALLNSIAPSMTSISSMLNQTFYNQMADVQRKLADIATIPTPPIVQVTQGIDWAKLIESNVAGQAAKIAEMQQNITNIAKAQLVPAIQALDWSKMVTVPVLGYMKQFTFPAVDTSWLKPLADQVGKTLAGFDTDFIRKLQERARREQEFLRREGPDNWTELGESVNIFILLGLAEEGIPVTWVPGPVVLEALTTTDKSDRLSTLLSHRDDALDDCDSALGQPTTGPLTEQASLLTQAVGAMRAGLFAAAQALAASVIDTVIRKAFLQPQRRYYSAVQEKIENSYEAQLVDLRTAVTYWPILPAFGEFYENRGDPIPSDFNRHATAHTVGFTQYTEANALLAVLLATSVVREAHIQLTTPTQPDTENSEHTTN